MLWLFLHQEANLQRVKKGDTKASIHRMEIDRIRFVLSSFLRSRLQKVSQVNNTVWEMKLSSHSVHDDKIDIFFCAMSRSKSSSLMSSREKSPEVKEIRHCFHPRSLLLPKSEYSYIKWLFELLFLWLLFSWHLFSRHSGTTLTQKPTWRP